MVTSSELLGIKLFERQPLDAGQCRSTDTKALFTVGIRFRHPTRYDTVVVTDAPDDETVAKLAIAAGGRGNVRTETLRAFTEEEAKKIAADLP